MVTKTRTKSFTLEITEDEAYTLQLLLGFVASDSEAYSVSAKLAYLTEYEPDTYDFDCVGFTLEGRGANVAIGTDENTDIVIRIK